MERKAKTTFFCLNCGYQSPKWLGRCPACGEWNRFVEEEVASASPGRNLKFHGTPVPITSIPAEERERWATGMGELDRILGGGLVPGSAILVGGDPGIGKSTLLLQLFRHLAKAGKKVLYVSGEESAKQIKLRGERIGALMENLYILVEIALDAIMEKIEETRPEAVAIDSIQTVYSPLLTSAPGSVGQIRESAEQLILLAKKRGIPLFLVGHVTKDGAIAGPKVLEHMVDTVLYFEGEGGQAFRLIRSIKNRFGPANEIGVFEMKTTGLEEVGNPSAYFLAERPEKAAGSVVASSMEGTRPILIEIQSLVIPASGFGIPRRTVIGVDPNRVSLLIAILDKICGYRLGGHDIFVNVAGGVKVSEPAVDLGICASLMSSFLDRPVAPDTVVFGEVGLAGEIRGSLSWEVRLKEAARLGFRRCIMPAGAGSRKTNPPVGNFTSIRIRSLKELPQYLF
ncbi:MAG TPA: DNA repair protein RadA [Syntrophales bacterium]|nr:DNA repair protein RadA [Syntrophales bacterium]HOL59201.1 DNA repair protein RadA [Syntrophales bacterium]HPO35718.1 DNA repair protein RadA [Syntrophales bacterium]